METPFKQVKRSKVTAFVTLRQSLTRGAYELRKSANNASRKAMGAKQQALAADLMLEAVGQLARDLYAAGWSSEVKNEVILWWPPVK